MSTVYGLIFADKAKSSLGELVRHRTSASLPYACRYRLIDFALSSMQNAGIRDVGVVMSKNYQSLLDHLGSGKAWDMSRRSGGMRLLPPFDAVNGAKDEDPDMMDRLVGLESFIRELKADYFLLTAGNLIANIDCDDLLKAHLDSGASVTLVMNERMGSREHFPFPVDKDGYLENNHGNLTENSKLHFLDTSIMSKSTLLQMIKLCAIIGGSGCFNYGLQRLIGDGCSIKVYMHEGYAETIDSIQNFYDANMILLNSDVRRDLFTADRPVHTKLGLDLSTYYSEEAACRNSLVADGCAIEGEVSNSILFRRVVVKKGAVIKNSIIMQDSVVSEGANLSYVISDKDVIIGAGVHLTGSPRLPIVLPKACVL